jgi:hypothetical protein
MGMHITCQPTVIKPAFTQQRCRVQGEAIDEFPTVPWTSTSLDCGEASLP